MTAALFHVLNHSLFKTLLFFGAGAVLTATGARDLGRLGGLLNRMPATGLFVLIGCAAISALPPLNGFVSEWLVFQAILLSPSLPIWGLRLMIPAVGAMLALAAALAAACFVRLFGIAFLGRPRSAEAASAGDVDRFSLTSMGLLSGLCLLTGIFPGVVIDALAPIVRGLVGANMTSQDAIPWLSIVPIAESRSSYNGLLVFFFIAFSALLAAFVIHRLASSKIRRAPAWDCGFPEADPITQYSAESFAQPVRRVYAGFAFRAEEKIDMPPPGDLRPARFEALPARPRVGAFLCAGDRRRAGCGQSAERAAIPHHSPISESGLRRPGVPSAGSRLMELIGALSIQLTQMLVVLLLAPLLTGFVRKVKARLMLRRGPPLLQPYHDLIKLTQKEAIVAESASWLFRVAPYLIFSATWVAAALTPTFAIGLLFSWSADLIAIIALLGSARFFLALAGMDVGTSFGGLGSSREMMFATLAEPALIMIVFTLALIAGSTQLSTVAAFMMSPAVGLRVSLGMALIALVIVAVAENARIPVDNPATHLELTMVHEAMVLEYSGRHLAMIELSSQLKLLLYMTLIACVFVPWGLAPSAANFSTHVLGFAAYVGKLAAAGVLLALVRGDGGQDAHFPCAGFHRRGADARIARHASAFHVAGSLAWIGLISTSRIFSPEVWS